MSRKQPGNCDVMYCTQCTYLAQSDMEVAMRRIGKSTVIRSLK